MFKLLKRESRGKNARQSINFRLFKNRNDIAALMFTNLSRPYNKAIQYNNVNSELIYVSI